MQEFTGAKMSLTQPSAGAATIALMNTKSLAQTQPIGPSATALPQQLEIGDPGCVHHDNGPIPRR